MQIKKNVGPHGLIFRMRPPPLTDHLASLDIFGWSLTGGSTVVIRDLKQRRRGRRRKRNLKITFALSQLSEKIRDDLHSFSSRNVAEQSRS